MSNFFCTILVLLCLSTISFSQSDTTGSSFLSKGTVIIKSGINIGKQFSTGYNTGAQLFGMNRTSLQFGAQLEYRLFTRIAIRTGVQLVNTGGKSEEFAGSDDEGRIIGTAQLVHELRYIEIPLQIVGYIATNGLRVYACPGISFGFLTNARYGYDADFETDVTVVDDDVSENLETMNFLILLAGGASLPISERIGIGIEAAYGLGVSNQSNQVQDNDSVLKSRDTRISIVLNIYL